jgi:hypothetical protein
MLVVSARVLSKERIGLREERGTPGARPIRPRVESAAVFMLSVMEWSSSRVRGSRNDRLTIRPDVGEAYNIVSRCCHCRS